MARARARRHLYHRRRVAAGARPRDHERMDAVLARGRIYSEAELRRILGTWFSDVSWRRVGQTACIAVARKGV